MTPEVKRTVIVLKKALRYCIRLSYRAVYNHPIIFSLGLVSYILYRNLPSIFSFLLSSSPVIVCTTLLLGVILSYGDISIPESEVVNSTSKQSVDAARNLSYFAQPKDDQTIPAKTSTSRKDFDEGEIKQSSMGENVTDRLASSEGSVPLLQKNYKTEKRSEASSVPSTSSGGRFRESTAEEKMSISGLRIESKREAFGETSGSALRTPRGGVSVRSRWLTPVIKTEPKYEHEDDDHLNFPALGQLQPDAPDGSSGTDSDQTENSSQDAPVSDMAPVIDEIHPLLSSEPSCPPPVNNNEFDSPHVSSDDSGDDLVTPKGGSHPAGLKKEDKMDAPFLWTDDDRKNAMDLGYSELERNRRLESLMAKRRSRKDIKFDPDKNLTDNEADDSTCDIDDSSGVPVKVPPISVPRRNPFDQLSDPEESMIPGSAPSVLHQHRNPFDLYSDQTYESSAVSRDTQSPRDHVSSSNRDQLFRRFDSFNLRSTEVKPDRRHSRFRPYFVPESFGFDELGSSIFLRQDSDKSVSKLSAILSTDSASSIADQDDHEVPEVRETEDMDDDGLQPPSKHGKEIADDESDSSDGINSVDVELDNSDMDDREMPMSSFEGTQLSEEQLHSTKVRVHDVITLGVTGPVNNLELEESSSQFPLSVSSSNQDTDELSINTHMILRDLHPIPEETAEDLKLEEQHRRDWSTTHEDNFTGMKTYAQNSDIAGEESSLAAMPTSSQFQEYQRYENFYPTDESNPFHSSRESTATGIFPYNDSKRSLESPEPEFDENILSELDAVGDFHSGELRPSHGVTGDAVESDLNGDAIISDSWQRESSYHINRKVRTAGAPHGNFLENLEQTVYKPRWRILDSGQLDDMETLLEQHGCSGQVLANDDDSKMYGGNKPFSHTNMEFVEANSVSDIYSAFEQVSAGHDEASNVHRVNKLFSNVDMEYVEATSVEDIYSAFEQVDAGHHDTMSVKRANKPFSSLSMEFVEAKSVADISSAFEQVDNGYVGTSKIDRVAKPSNHMEFVEAKSVVDIYSAFEESIADHGETSKLGIVSKPCNSSDMEFVEAKSVADIFSVFEQADAGHDDASKADKMNKPSSSLHMEFVEARSIADIGSAFVQISAAHDETSKADGVDKLSNSMELVEARSIVDIYSAFKQANAGPDEEPKVGKVNNSSNHLETVEANSVAVPRSLKVDTKVEYLEAKSVADIGKAFQQASGGSSNTLVQETGKPHISLMNLGVAETPRKLHTVEARTLDELDEVFEKLAVGTANDVFKAEFMKGQFLDLRPGLDTESMHAPHTDDDEGVPGRLQFLQAQSLDEISSSFKKLSNSTTAYEETERWISASELEDGLPRKLIVVDATSLDDIDAAFRKLANGIAGEN